MFFDVNKTVFTVCLNFLCPPPPLSNKFCGSPFPSVAPVAPPLNYPVAALSKSVSPMAPLNDPVAVFSKSVSLTAPLNYLLASRGPYGFRLRNAIVQVIVAVMYSYVYFMYVNMHSNDCNRSYHQLQKSLSQNNEKKKRLAPLPQGPLI